MEVQEAIEKIGKEVNGLTILIIAHRLTTIQSANNLLFFRSRSHLDYASKGSQLYNQIFETIKNIAYSLGDDSDNKKDENASDTEDEGVEIIEEQLGDHNPANSLNKQTMEEETPLSKMAKVEPSKDNWVERKLSQKSANYRVDSMRSDLSGQLLLSDSGVETTKVAPFRPREVKTSEIMSYYTPKWMAGVGFMASVFCAFQLPMFGFCLAQYVFLLLLPPQSQEFIDARNTWTYAFGFLCVGIGLSTYV